MSEKLLTDAKMITCILPAGKSASLMRTLKKEKGIITARVNHARGTGRLTPLAYRGIAGQTEKEIFSVLVDAEQADELFADIYHLAGIGEVHGGLMYQHGVPRASRYELPADLPEEED